MADAVTIDRGAEVPELLRGSVITLGRKCGKPNCRCAVNRQPRTSRRRGRVRRGPPRRKARLSDRWMSQMSTFQATALACAAHS